MSRNTHHHWTCLSCVYSLGFWHSNWGILEFCLEGYCYAYGNFTISDSELSLQPPLQLVLLQLIFVQIHRQRPMARGFYCIVSPEVRLGQYPMKPQGWMDGPLQIIDLFFITTRITKINFWRFLFCKFAKNMTELDKYEHIWYQIKGYSAGNVMGCRKYAYLCICTLGISNMQIPKLSIT